MVPLGAVARALARRPMLWPTAVVELRRLARPRWWQHWPPVPRPDPEYLRFRMQTAYGDVSAIPSPADLVDYLAWCRRMNSLTGHRVAVGKWRRRRGGVR